MVSRQPARRGEEQGHRGKRPHRGEFRRKDGRGAGGAGPRGAAKTRPTSPAGNSSPRALQQFLRTGPGELLRARGGGDEEGQNEVAREHARGRWREALLCEKQALTD